MRQKVIVMNGQAGAKNSSRGGTLHVGGEARSGKNIRGEDDA
jgi:hypothetical protein